MLFRQDEVQVDTLKKFVSLRDGKYIYLVDNTPKIDESLTVSYQSKNVPQLPTSINYYESTSARTFSVSNISLVSRTRDEATENQRIVAMLRAWCKPVFGEGDAKKLKDQHKLYDQHTSIDENGKQKDIEFIELYYTLGMPPPILLFSAYQGTDPSGNPNKLGRSGIQDVPVVITNLSIEWTDDVDYIPSKYNAPVPIIQTISLTLLDDHLS